MAIDGVMAQVGAAADEPARKRRPAVIEHLRKRRLPFDQRRPFAPERTAVMERAAICFGVFAHPASRIESSRQTSPLHRAPGQALPVTRNGVPGKSSSLGMRVGTDA